MKEYLIRIDDGGMVTDFMELEEDEGMQADELAPCDECQQLEAVMVAMVRNLRDENRQMRDELIMLGKRVADLEKRPMVASEPLYPAGFDHLVRPWIVTYGTVTNSSGL